MIQKLLMEEAQKEMAALPPLPPRRPRARAISLAEINEGGRGDQQLTMAQVQSGPGVLSAGRALSSGLATPDTCISRHVVAAN